MPVCEICGGVGFEIVVKDDHDFAKICACRATGAKGPDIFERLRVPARFRGCTIANFESTSSPQLRKVWEQAATFAAGYPHTGVSAGLGLLFTGRQSGVGKTHLAVAVLRELAETKKTYGQFWDYLELMREIRSSYDPEVRMTEMQALEPFIKTSVLLLDDLGALKITDWMHDTLFYILNQRYVHQRPTIITTNFEDRGPDQATKRNRLEQRDLRDFDVNRFGRHNAGATLSDGREPDTTGAGDTEYLGERIGTRLRSRLQEMCVLLRMTGTDHREHRQHYNQSGALDAPTTAR